MYSLITYATEWGYSHGGINSFNTDLLSAFGYAYPEGLQVICIVSKASEEEILNAKQANVIVIPLPKATENKIFSIEDAIAGIAELKRRNIVFTPLKTIWLGHDLITGLAATYSSKSTGSKSALLHHMSYNHYESYAESSSIAKLKISEQKILFDTADIVLAVGPLLRDSIKDLLGPTKTVHMVIPGLADNYTSHLSENGCYKNAVTIGKQALIVIERLAKEVPNRYETDFANFLSFYSTILSKNGEVNEAIKLTEQALDIQQRLAKDHPERYEFDLAKTLNDHANHLCKDGKTKDAIKLSEQALEIYQRLAKDHPERYELDLTKTLNDYQNLKMSNINTL